MGNYEELLEDAYDNVKPVESCGRFEILKAEGHIEGSKTIISNFNQIAACLRRKPEHLAKFLFKELASSGDISGDRVILTTKISSQKINEKTKKYADCYVLCQKCKKPDTELVEDEGFIRCLACGHKKHI
jgi:putative translation initiation factor aIF-2 beta subunit